MASFRYLEFVLSVVRSLVWGFCGVLGSLDRSFVADFLALVEQSCH